MHAQDAHDAHTLLALESEVTYAVLGAPGSSGEFVLVEMGTHTNETLTALTETATLKGWRYCGSIGVKDGKANAACEPDPARWFTMMHAALAAARLIADRLRPASQGNAIGWLEALSLLPDLRT